MSNASESVLIYQKKKVGTFSDLASYSCISTINKNDQTTETQLCRFEELISNV